MVLNIFLNMKFVSTFSFFLLLFLFNFFTKKLVLKVFSFHYKKHWPDQCLGSGSVGSETFWLPGSESAKIPIWTVQCLSQILTERFFKNSLFLNGSSSFSPPKKINNLKILLLFIISIKIKLILSTGPDTICV